MSTTLPTADQLKKQIGSGVVMVTSVTQGRVSVVIAVTQDLTTKLNAVDLVKIASQALGGQGGGGRPDMAQAGGINTDQIAQAIAAVSEAIGGISS